MTELFSDEERITAFFSEREMSVSEIKKALIFAGSKLPVTISAKGFQEYKFSIEDVVIGPDGVVLMSSDLAQIF